MVEMYVSELIPGKRLAKEVNTELGGTLFQQGHVLVERDIEVLRAFLIRKVMIEVIKNISIKESGKVAEEKEAIQEIMESPLFEEKSDIIDDYKQVVRKTARLFQNIESGSTPQIIEIRQYLIPFVEKALNNPTLVLTLPTLSQQDTYLVHHAVSVATLSSFIATKIGFSAKEIPQVALAGYLHNIGQLKIDKRIIFKNEPLTTEEFSEVQRHPELGYTILKKVSGISQGVVLSALLHHEREDGSGYPLGVKAEKIHDFAKIVAIADIYYAMCTERVYKKALSPFLVLEQLQNDSFGKLNPKFVHAFIDLVTSFVSIGRLVRLSDGKEGKVVYIHKSTPTRPIVNCQGELIDLQLVRNVYLDKIFL